jgi:hypothetical protein
MKRYIHDICEYKTNFEPLKVKSTFFSSKKVIRRVQWVPTTYNKNSLWTTPGGGAVYPCHHRSVIWHHSVKTTLRVFLIYFDFLGRSEVVRDCVLVLCFEIIELTSSHSSLTCLHSSAVCRCTVISSTNILT